MRYHRDVAVLTGLTASNCTIEMELRYEDVYNKSLAICYHAAMAVIQNTPKEKQTATNEMFTSACSIIRLYFQSASTFSDSLSLQEEAKIGLLESPATIEKSVAHLRSTPSKNSIVETPIINLTTPEKSDPKIDSEEKKEEKTSAISLSTALITQQSESHNLLLIAEKETTAIIEKDMNYLKENGLGDLIEVKSDSISKINFLKIAIQKNKVAIFRNFLRKSQLNPLMKQELLYYAIDTIEKCENDNIVSIHGLLRIITNLIKNGADPSQKIHASYPALIRRIFEKINMIRFYYATVDVANKILNRLTKQLLAHPVSKEDLYFVIQTIIELPDSKVMSLFKANKIKFSKSNIQQCMDLQYGIVNNNFSDKIKFLMLCLNSSINQKFYKRQITFRRSKKDKSCVDNQTFFDFITMLIKKNKKTLCQNIRFARPNEWLNFLIHSKNSDEDKFNNLLIFCKNYPQDLNLFMQDPKQAFQMRQFIQTLFLQKIKRIIMQKDTSSSSTKAEFFSVASYNLLKSRQLFRNNFSDFIEKYFHISTSPGTHEEKTPCFRHDKTTRKACNDMLINGFSRFPELAMLLEDLYLESPMRIPNKISFLSDLSDTDLVYLVTTAMNSTAHAKMFAKALALRKIDFAEEGTSIDNFSAFALHLLSRASAPISLKSPSTSQLIREIEKSSIEIKEDKKSDTDFMSQLTKKGWKFLRLQGRTIIMKNASGKCLAIKIQKVGESLSELKKEFHSAKIKKQYAEELELKTRFPTPLSIIDITNVREFFKLAATEKNKKNLEDFMHLVGGKPSYAYVYETENENYFTYLNDPTLSDEQFRQANQDIIWDLCKILSQKIVYPQLIDMFHVFGDENDSRADKGRYLVLINLFYLFIENIHGTGRTANWKGSAEFPNVRLSGLADVGDSIKLSDFDSESKRTSYFYSFAKKFYGDKAGNFLVANILAEYQYSLFLVAGRRAFLLDQQTTSEEKKKSIWRNTAQQVLKNCVQMLAMLSGIPERTAQIFLSSCIDVEYLAKQMQYWMTPLCMTRSIKEVYHPNVEILLKDPITDSALYNLGVTESGQEPIKEFNTLLYMMVIGIAGQYKKQELTKMAGEEKISTFDHLPIYQKIKTQLFFDRKHLKKMYASSKIDNTTPIDFLSSPITKRFFDNKKKLMKAHARCRSIIKLLR